MRGFLNRFYEKQSPEKYKQNLIALFIEDKKWDDYDKLKELCSQEEWPEMLSTIIGGLSKGRFGDEYTIIDIYLREELFEQALRGVIVQRNLSALSRYHNDLFNRYPEEYFNAYRELIISFAESKMGRAHYQEIVRYLKQMKQIKGFEGAFRELVSLLKAQYSNRPAFLDEMRGV